MDLSEPDDQARRFTCERLPMLFEHLNLAVDAEIPGADADEAALSRTLTSWQSSLSLVATQASENADWKRSEQASLLAAACNALTLYYHVRCSQAALAARVLHGVARFLDKAARLELMPPRWAVPGSIGLDLREIS